MDDAAEVGIRGGTQIGTDLATARSAPIPIQPTPDPPSTPILGVYCVQFKMR